MKQRKATRKTGSTKRTSAARKRPAQRALSPVVALAPECAIESADSLKADLLCRLEVKGAVSIDASAVQRIDTATLQVLAAFTRDRGAAGLPVEWIGVPAALSAAARLLDLSTTFGFADGAATP